MLLALNASSRRDFIILVSAGALYMCSASFTLLLPRYFVDIGATAEQIGWLIALPVPFYVSVTLLSGWLADRMSVRWLGVLGILLSASASWALVLQDNIDSAVWMLRAIQGMGHALAITPIVTMASRSLGVSYRAQGIGYFAVCMQMGNIVGTLLAAMLIEGLGYNAYFGVAMFLALVGAGVFTQVGSTNDSPLANANISDKDVGHGRYLHGLLLMLVLAGAFGMVLQYSAVLLDHLVAVEQLASPFSVSWILTVLLAAVIAVRLLAPPAIYRPGNTIWMLSAMAGIPISMLLFPNIQGIGGAVLVASLLGVSYGLLLPTVHALCLNRAGTAQQGWAVGLTNLTFECGYRGFGFFIGPVIGAFGFNGMFLTLAGLTTLGIGIFLLVERR